MCRAAAEGGRRCAAHSNSLPRKAAKSRADYAMKTLPVEVLDSPVQGLPLKPFAGLTKKGRVKGRPLDIIHVYTPGEYTIEQVRDAAEMVDLLYEAEGKQAEELEELISQEYGSPLQAVQFVGIQIAGRAEELAGVNGESLRKLVEDKKTELNYDKLCEELDEKTSEGIRIWETRNEAGEFTGLNLEEYQKKYYAFMDEHSIEAKKAWLEAENTLRDVAMDGKTKLADSYREVLSTVRPLGGKLKIDDISDVRASEVALQAAQVFPSDWLKASDASGSLVVVDVETRAHYSHDNFVIGSRSLPPKIVKSKTDPSIIKSAYEEYKPVESKTNLLGYRKYEKQEFDYIDGSITSRPDGPDWEYYSDGHLFNGWRRPKRVKVESSGLSVNKDAANVLNAPEGYAVAVHELSHRMERIAPGLSRMENHWLLERTTSKKGEREPLISLDNGRDDEFVRQDSFVVSYIGKEYEANGWHHEVMSVGMQALFGGDYGGLIGVDSKRSYQADLDMRSFILGALASSGFSKIRKTL